jgi:hypothetical protein
VLDEVGEAVVLRSFESGPDLDEQGANGRVEVREGDRADGEPVRQRRRFHGRIEHG